MPRQPHAYADLDQATTHQKLLRDPSAWHKGSTYNTHTHSEQKGTSTTCHDLSLCVFPHCTQAQAMRAVLR